MINTLSLSLRSTSSIWKRSQKYFATVQTHPYKETLPSKIDLNALEKLTFAGDILVIPFYKPTSVASSKNDSLIAEALKNVIPPSLDANTKNIVEDILNEYTFKGDVASKQVIRMYSKEFPVKYIALVGLGPSPTNEDKDLDVKSAARLGKLVSTIAKELKIQSAGVVVPPGFSNSGLTQFLLGIYDNLYVDNRYKKVPEEGFPALKFNALTLLGCSEVITRDALLTQKLTEMISSGVNFAKDLVAAPPNSKNPLVIADLATQLAADYKLSVKILGEQECKDLKMGGYLGVQQGSMFPPQFIHLTYKPENPIPGTTVSKVALIGKGLTFDSGGYNLKAGAGSMIELMKFDMGGCGAVLGCAKAIAQLRPKNVEVHFITAVCENMISAEAMRPGDILTASNGKTIEVLNTDAEGRLTLADALVYAEKLEVDTIIDLATLTGACIVALGEKVAGFYTPDKLLQADLENAAKRSDESIWNMPLEPAYKDMIKSSIADLKNIGGKGGGSITAALFLQEFVEKAKWAHIGPVWDTSSSRATGFGVKLLVDYLLNAKPVAKTDDATK
eukprot:gene4922-6888_t